MSRHRNVRSMNYNDEFEGYDDVYGHSVEDDCCISPSDAAQFMYDRSRQSAQISAFFNESDNIAEEEEPEDHVDDARKDSEPSIKPQLSELDEARLQSCLDEIRNVIGDTVPENIIVETVLKNSFDLSKSLDAVLSHESSEPKIDAPKPQRVRNDRNRDDDFIDVQNFSPNCWTGSSNSDCEHKYTTSITPRHFLDNLDTDDLISSADLLKNQSTQMSNDIKERMSPIFCSKITVGQPIDKVSPLPAAFKTRKLGDNQLIEAKSFSTGGKPVVEKKSKFHIPQFHKIRKDSDKENLADDGSDSEEVSFSSLAALAKHYTSKEITKEVHESRELLDTTNGKGLFKNVFEDKESRSCNDPVTHLEHLKQMKKGCFIPETEVSDIFSPTASSKYLCENSQCEDLIHSTDPGSQSYPAAGENPCRPPSSPVDKPEKTSEPTKAINFQASNVKIEDLISMSTSLCISKQFTNDSTDMISDSSMSSDNQYSDDVAGSSCTLRQLPSLSEIVSDHLIKSASYCTPGSYDVLKSESCPQICVPSFQQSGRDQFSPPNLVNIQKTEGTDYTVMETSEECIESDNWIIDLSCALKIQRNSSSVNGVISGGKEFRKSSVVSPEIDKFFVPNLPCSFDESQILNVKYEQARRHLSSFGKVLCRKWKQKQCKVLLRKEHSKTVASFSFDTPSPDDSILMHLGWS